MIRIRCEIPQFKRCCMCLPLRHGLIVWGYIRLVIDVLLLYGATDYFIFMLGLNKEEQEYSSFQILYPRQDLKAAVFLYGFLTTVGGVDIVLNVVFVYAGHKKDQKMLKVYYIYSLILWVIMTILAVYLFAHDMYMLSLDEINLYYFLPHIVGVLTLLAQIGIHAYVLLLVRSEYMKLTRDYELRLNAAVSVCKMNCEENNMANEYIIADESITIKKYDIPNTNAIADGNITANRNVIGVKEVNETETSESIDTMPY